MKNTFEMAGSQESEINYSEYKKQSEAMIEDARAEHKGKATEPVVEALALLFDQQPAEVKALLAAKSEMN